MVLDELSHPIVQAPMAGGPSTVELAAAVCEAGGLGFLAAGYRSAEHVRDEIHELCARTSAPFGVNVFVPGDPDEAQPEALGAYLQELEGDAARYGTGLGEPRYDDDSWSEKLDVLREERVPVVSFTFGCPAARTIASLRDGGSEAWVTATSVPEAHAARDAGADALVLQGIEAGGHRGAFCDPGGEELSALALLRLVASEVELPLVSAGGIADGPAVAAVMAAGAAAAQVGTAFMLAPEAGTHPAHRAVLAEETRTALTRAFTGRRARGLQNRFMEEHSANAPIAYPHLHHATAPLRAAARARGDADGFNLWAGQTHRLAAELPAAEIVRALSRDAQAALERAVARFPD